MALKVYGVDFGTSMFKLYKKGKGIVVDEKNIIAIENGHKVMAIGNEAFEMYEKAPENVLVTYPVRNGVIADIAYMEALFSSFIKHMCGGSKPSAADYIVAVPTDITEVEKRAFADLIMSSIAKVHSIRVVEKPIAAALGADLDITNAHGVMVVDLGADTTEISVLSLGGIVLSRLLPVGGNRLDEAIAMTIKKHCNLYIGAKTAEQLKIELGSAYPDSDEYKSIYGRDVVTGLPTKKDISSKLIHEAIKDYLFQIIDAIKMILERTPPEISSDIIDSGIYITGGGAKIKGFDTLISQCTELNVNICSSPSNTVANGLGRMIEDPTLITLTQDIRRTVR